VFLAFSYVALALGVVALALGVMTLLTFIEFCSSVHTVRGVYPPRGHGAFPPKMAGWVPQFLIIMHVKCCADR